MKSEKAIYNLIKENPLSVKEIAERLTLAETTIRMHCHQMVEMQQIGMKVKFLYGNYHHPYAVYGGAYREN